MRDDDAPQHDPTSAVTPPIVCDLPDDVATVEPLTGYRLNVRFHDGVSGIVDLSRRVVSSRAGVFAALADPTLFARVGVELGAVAWPCGVDLAPDAMHDELAAHGEWVLS
jgi:hypothetical protein